MNRLLQFLFKYRTLLVFIVLEGFCFWIIVKSNSYHSTKYFTSSNRLAASILNLSDNVGGYFSLTEKNKLLAEENARLRQRILLLSDSSDLATLTAPDSLRSLVLDTLDSINFSDGIHARIIDNSVFLRNNYLTINKGAEDGVFPKMGVIGPDGIVGQVKYVSDHYATVVSILHSRSLISAKHAISNGLCTIQWNGESPEEADIAYFPRHIRLNIGDSILTSGYNSIFPEGELVGIVNHVHLDDAATFYEAKIKLATDFYRLKHVYLLRQPDKAEIDSLTIKTMEEDGQI
ncbi:rod shape-determining protein MreC [Reichenbachiella ulvae]|uniref:Cell shape-determining protein MreC n=1 Tax=Reichenbachiella ulvae TaxID=2980104 RepID=A0ABT3CY31_9BACT|nr:rod shape-determining protein MreC [Reichenbachiella ulvae]MCV9388610.1 rod shape-determining protein MreC [Reichenbachiella ulvae]